MTVGHLHFLKIQEQEEKQEWRQEEKPILQVGKRMLSNFTPTMDFLEYYVRPSFQPNNNVRPPVFS